MLLSGTYLSSCGEDLQGPARVQALGVKRELMEHGPEDPRKLVLACEGTEDELLKCSLGEVLPDLPVGVAFSQLMRKALEAMPWGGEIAVHLEQPDVVGRLGGGR